MTPSPVDALLAGRTADRRARAVAGARAALGWLAGEGVEAAVVGSLATGRFALHSDVDLLVLACPADRRYAVEAGVEDRMGGLPFDVLHLDELPPSRRARTLAEAVRASDLR